MLSHISGPTHLMPGVPPVMTTTNVSDMAQCPLEAKSPLDETLQEGVKVMSEQSLLPTEAPCGLVSGIRGSRWRVWLHQETHNYINTAHVFCWEGGGGSP